MEEIIKLLNEIKDDVKEMKIDMKLMKERQACQIEKQKSLEEKIINVEKKICYINEQESSKNIILYNVQDDDETNKALVTNVLNIIKEAEVDIPNTCIGDIQRLGWKKNVNNRPVLIKLLARRWKSVFFEKEQKFKSLGYEVSSDIPKEKRALKATLLKARYLLRQKGKNPVLRNFNLYLDNRQISAEEISALFNEKIISPEIVQIDNNSSQDTEVDETNKEPIKEPMSGTLKPPQNSNNGKITAFMKGASSANASQQQRVTRSNNVKK